MGFLSSHDVSVPPGLPVVVVCCQLVWVVYLLPLDGFSTCYVVPHMLTQSFLNFLPVFRIIGAHQILLLKFFQNGFADLGDKFADGRSSNPPVVLQ